MTSEGQHAGQPAEANPGGGAEPHGADGFPPDSDGQRLPSRTAASQPPPYPPAPSSREPNSYGPPPHATPGGGSPFVVPAVSSFGQGPETPPSRPPFSPGPQSGSARVPVPDDSGALPQRGGGQLPQRGTASPFGPASSGTAAVPDGPPSAWAPPPSPPAGPPAPAAAPFGRGDDAHPYRSGGSTPGVPASDFHGFAPGSPTRASAGMEPSDQPDGEQPGSARPPGISAFGDQRIRVPGATLTGLPDALPPLPDDSGALPRRGQAPDAAPNGAGGTGQPSRDQSPYGESPYGAAPIPGRSPLPSHGNAFGVAQPSPAAAAGGSVPAASGSAQPGNADAARFPFGQQPSSEFPSRPPFGGPDPSGELPSRQPTPGTPSELPRAPFGSPAPSGDLPSRHPYGSPDPSGELPSRQPFGAASADAPAFGQPAPGSQVYGQQPADGGPISGPRSYGEPTSGGAAGSADQPQMPTSSPFGSARPGEPTPFDGRSGDPGGEANSTGRPFGTGSSPYGAPAQPFGAQPATPSAPGRPGDSDQRSVFERPATDHPGFERHDANRPSFDRPDQNNPDQNRAPSDRPVFGSPDTGQPGPAGQPGHIGQPLFGQAGPPGSASTGPGSGGFAQRVPGASFGATPAVAPAEPGSAPLPPPRDPAERPATGTARPASASASVPMASRVAPVTPEELPPPPAAKQARVYGRAATTPSDTDAEPQTPPPADQPVSDGRPGADGAWPWDAKRQPDAYQRGNPDQQPPAPAPQSPARVAGRASASARVSPPGQDAPPSGPPFTEFTTDVAGRGQKALPPGPGAAAGPGAQGRATPPEQYGENTTDISGRGRPGGPGTDAPYVPAPALPSMHASPPRVDGFPPPGQQPAPPGIEGDRPRMGGVFPGPATRATVTPPPGPDETASWPNRGDQPEADQGRFDQFKPEVDAVAPVKSEPATPHVRMLPVILGVIIGAALLVGLAFGLVYLISGDSDSGFSVSAGECVKQDGEEAVKVSCTEAGAFEVVSIADTREQCADPGQPYVINPTSDGRSQVLCLKPR